MFFLNFYLEEGDNPADNKIKREGSARKSSKPHFQKKSAN
jgi:hypothetical protein